MSGDSTTACPRCARACTEIKMTPARGRSLTMLRCARCDWQSWRASIVSIQGTDLLGYINGAADFSLREAKRPARSRTRRPVVSA